MTNFLLIHNYVQNFDLSVTKSDDIRRKRAIWMLAYELNTKAVMEWHIPSCTIAIYIPQTVYASRVQCVNRCVCMTGVVCSIIHDPSLRKRKRMKLFTCLIISRYVSIVKFETKKLKTTVFQCKRIFWTCKSYIFRLKVCTNTRWNVKELSEGPMLVLLGVNQNLI